MTLNNVTRGRRYVAVPRGEEYRDTISFDQTMGAIVSNSKAGDFDVTVVCERRMTPTN